MNKDRDFLISVAEKRCLPSFEKAINNYVSGKPYLEIDHISIDCSKMEELLRSLWGFAPLLKSKEYFITVTGEKRELSEAIRWVILKASDEKDEKCLSRFSANRHEICFANQMITEFAGYCIAVTLAPEKLWYPYSKDEQERIGAWIKKWAVMALKNSWRNNHFWFPMLAVVALEKMGIDCGDVDDAMNDGFKVLDTMYIDCGWYKDGGFGRFDFYLAWSHHFYPLLWAYISQGTRFYDNERAEEYKRRTAEFFDYYTHMFDFDGSVAAFGRSLSYRYAQSAFFAAAALTDCKIDMGVARRCLIKNVEYFENNVITEKDNVFPAGYLYKSTGIVENYTSSGGAYWCSKVFVALLMDEKHPFWQAEEGKMPIEKGDFILNSPVESINMVLEGNKKSGITLFNNTATAHIGGIYGGRFNDMASYYSKFVYNSRSGFGISSADNCSSDNMISLETADGTLTSRRNGFTDEGYVDGVLISSHKPFSNDMGTSVRSFVVPLGDGFHVKAHRVKLSQPYKIIEGGFSIGTYDDGSKGFIDKNEVTYSDGYGKKSGLHTVSDTPFKYQISYHMPGLHILAPQSAYPAYVTEVLPAGDYIFASLFMLNVSGERPEISLEGNVLEIKYKEIYKRIIIQ